ncbi:PAS domain-containing protein [Rhizobium sp.]
MHTESNAVVEIANPTDAAGVYLWDIGTDTVFSDSAAAEAFGFAADVAKGGMPISMYLERMHPDDLPRVAEAIRDAIVSGGPYQEEYRVCHPDGAVIEVLAVGSCFKNQDGEPFQYAGLLFPKEVSPGAETSIRQLCLMAYELAQKDGKVEVAEKLVEILVSLGRQQFEERIPAAACRH